MDLAAKLDDIGKPAWIGLMVLGFILYWPIGLAILAYLAWSGRMGCWRRGRLRRWQREGVERAYAAAERWCGEDRPASSGNRAFDEYRTETLRRLEEEQREFKEFLERLRIARDKAEFDQFLAERRRRTEGPEAPQQG
jgi:biopolymer transport protein ExbB/TolQ